MFRTWGNPGYREGKSCDQCKKGPARPEFYSQTSSYYRNKASGHYYFCGKACKDAFNATRRCKWCGYGSSLQDTRDGYVLCSDNVYDVPCYDAWREKKIVKEAFIDHIDLLEKIEEFVGSQTTQ